MAQTDRAKESSQAQQKQEKTPEQLEQQEAQANQAQEQLRNVMTEVLAPMQKSLTDLQEKYQSLATQRQEPVEPPLTPEEQMDKMIGNLGDEDKFDKLSNRQLVDVMSSAFDSALKTNATQVKDSVLEGLKPDLEKVGNLEKVTMKIMAGLGVQQARSQHKDFDEHIEEIKAVLETYPGMSYDDAYYLAKSHKAGSIPPASHIDTEKPGSTVAVPSNEPTPPDLSSNAMEIMAERGKESRAETKHGIVQFRELCEAAAEKVLSARD